eukprot:1176948-Prorocentrum_minimum.AAC.6
MRRFAFGGGLHQEVASHVAIAPYIVTSRPLGAPNIRKSILPGIPCVREESYPALTGGWSGLPDGQLGFPRPVRYQGSPLPIWQGSPPCADSLLGGWLGVAAHRSASFLRTRTRC